MVGAALEPGGGVEDEGGGERGWGIKLFFFF